ncbi:shikimate kinase [Lactobacillus sp. S2-2]|uniref:shikimate kinase n=1 Tax=Lactobacillus sp. S2-2 TaxID=2692917 RepID=UPI001F26264E|nr:shikimate kinase [Lactobacillus sp. S2-2]MCF6514603.1 shikimate kinase [Lactobacillus sp. S2-2]
MQLVLIGFMSSGKTTIGSKLAEKMNLPFYDLDQVIEEQIHMTIPEYFKKYDENQFRQIENKIFKQILNSSSGIISTGGGTIEDIENINLLNNSNTQIIFLDISDKTIQRRLENDTNRPLVKELGISGLINLKHQRNKKYEQLSNMKIMTDDFSISGTLEQIENNLRRQQLWI